MTDSEYLQQAQSLFNQVQIALEAEYPDWDIHQSGVVLEIENDEGEKVIINQQAPMQEVWLASRAGGYHFRWQEGQWVNTRDGQAFSVYLAQAVQLLNRA